MDMCYEVTVHITGASIRRLVFVNRQKLGQGKLRIFAPWGSTGVTYWSKGGCTFLGVVRHLSLN